MTGENEARLAERRKYVRISKEFVVRVVERPEGEMAPGQPVSDLAPKDGLAREEMRGKNISLGGVAIESRTEYAVGSTLGLEIFLPELEKYLPPLRKENSSQESGLFRVEGEVRWIRALEGGRFAIGLRFIKLDERQFKALSQLVTQKTPA